MTFHILAIPHTKTTKEFSPCPFTQQTRLLCKMLTEAGHTVYHYGTEGSAPICTENIAVLSDKTHSDTYGWVDWKSGFFDFSRDNKAVEEFKTNSIIEINKRKKDNEFLLCTFGNTHKPISDSVGNGMIVVEPGIGYSNVFAPHKVFTTYNWMHYVYGIYNTVPLDGNNMLSPLFTPPFYDAVISYPFDINDYIYSDKKDNYFLFIGRLLPHKGVEIAVRSAIETGNKLYIAGQGDKVFTHPNIEYIGTIDIEQRAKWMSKAKAVFVPSLNNEPFGMVVVESLLSGTPVITTDFGSFPELVPHGLVGYRCRTMSEFVWATNNISNIKSVDCRSFAENNFSTSRVLEKLEYYFNNLYQLYTTDNAWYNTDMDVNGLKWLDFKL